MQKFKHGDKIVCIDPYPNTHLTVGKIYIVLEAKTNETVVIYNDNGHMGFYTQKIFELADSQLPDWF